MGQYLSTDFFTDIQKKPTASPVNPSPLNPSPLNPSPLNPSPPPMSGKGGLIALRNAEYIDQYRRKIEESSVNTIARRNQEYMPVVYSVSRAIPSNTTWPNGEVIWMDSSADGGLPHTRPPHYICLPINIPDSILSNTLIHERIHLSQRAHPKEWQTLFKIAWNMTPWYGKLPGRIEHLRRINPDLINVPLYAWKQEWVVVCVFTSSMPKSLSETSLLWWHIPTSTVHRSPPPGWVEFFGSNTHNEHPYEISAYLLADSGTDAPTALAALQVNLSSVQK